MDAHRPFPTITLAPRRSLRRGGRAGVGRMWGVSASDACDLVVKAVSGRAGWRSVRGRRRARCVWCVCISAAPPSHPEDPPLRHRLPPPVADPTPSTSAVRASRYRPRCSRRSTRPHVHGAHHNHQRDHERPRHAVNGNDCPQSHRQGQARAARAVSSCVPVDARLIAAVPASRATARNAWISCSPSVRGRSGAPMRQWR
jgi:hypothetical protein